MILFHLSPIYNRKSIQELGIIPTLIKNSDHLEYFKQHKVLTKDNKGIYTWESHYNNEKIIKDLIYAIVWLHPRNEIAENKWQKNETMSFEKDDRQPIYKYDQMLFDVYTTEAECFDHTFIHFQKPSSNSVYDTAYRMHEKFSHDDKKLHILNKPIKDFKRIKDKGFYYYDFANKKFVIKVI